MPSRKDPPNQPTEDTTGGDGKEIPGLVPADDDNGEAGDDSDQRYPDMLATKTNNPSPTLLVNEKPQCSSQRNNAALRQRIHARIVSLLQRYVNFVGSSSWNQDKGIKFLQYTLWLASKLYSKDASGRKGLVKLSNELSMARYVTRLLQFPMAIEAVLTQSWTSKSTRFPKTFRMLGDLLAWSMVVYYPAEHVAYLQWTAPQWLLPSSSTSDHRSRSAEQWSAWSCRGWLAYILAEMVQGALQWKELKQQQREEQRQRALDQKDTKGSSREKEQQQQLDEIVQQTSRALQNTKLQFTRNALFLLPAIQYSLPNWDRDPWLPPDWINFLFWLESVVCLYQASV